MFDKFTGKWVKVVEKKALRAWQIYTFAIGSTCEIFGGFPKILVGNVNIVLFRCFTKMFGLNLFFCVFLRI